MMEGGAGREPSAALVVESRLARNAVVVIVSGELDMVTAPELRPAIELSVPEGIDRLVLDLTQLQFLAAAGLKVLVDVCDLAGDRGVAVRVVVGQNRAVTRPLEITGLDKVLPLSPSLEQALGERGHPPDVD